MKRMTNLASLKLNSSPSKPCLENKMKDHRLRESICKTHVE
jgi:hypothetical protein